MAVAVESFGDPAFGALEGMIKAAKATDALAPVTVIVPSNYTGLSLRRRLSKGGSVVNIRFLVLARVAELLGAPLLSSEKRPLTAWTRAEAIRATLSDHGGFLESMAAHPATESALDATFRDLRLASDAALDRMSASSEKGAELVVLYRRFQGLTESTYDLEDLAESATDGVRSGSAALEDLGRILLYLPRSLSPAETELVREFMKRDAVDIVLGRTHDPWADQGCTDLSSRLGIAPSAFESGDEPAVATGILRTIDAEEEVRSVIRLSMAATARGTPLYRMGVVFASSDVYAPLIQEQFKAAGVPFNGPPMRRLIDSMAGRLLMGALKLPDSNFRREAVMDWLTTGPVIETSEGPDRGRWVPGHYWDQISREAGIVGGIGQFTRRLQTWADAEGRRAHEMAGATRLASFMSEMERRLKPPKGASMNDLLGWGLGLMDRYLGSETTASGWENEAELEAYQEIRRRLVAAVNAGPLLDKTADSTSKPSGLRPDEARQFLARIIQQSLQDASGRLGSFGDGVFVGSLKTARGMDFDQLFVLGMVEGSMPPPSREDPLISDRERDLFHLPGRDLSRSELRTDYLAALASSSERTLCFSQSSLRSQSKQIPSRWLLESASSLEQGLMSSDDFEQLRSAPWLTAVASFQHALGTHELPVASLQEWELRTLLGAADPRAHFLGKQPFFGARFDAATARFPTWLRRGAAGATGAAGAGDLSPWSGAVGSGVSLDLKSGDTLDPAKDSALKPGGSPDPANALTPNSRRSYSATSFELLAACPFRFFLDQVGRVRVSQRPEEIIRISGADRGNIIHDSLERFLSETKVQGRSLNPDEPWQESDAARLQAIAAEECEKAHERGITGGELFWEVDQGRIKRDLGAFLIADAGVRAETRARFIEAEHAFGSLDRDGHLGMNSWPTVDIALESGRNLAFRGRIDRVDKADDGTLIVYDYKSGSGSGLKPTGKGIDRLAAGRRLQLPIYALAARAALGEAGVPVRAYYWLTSEREHFAQIGFELTGEDEAALSKTLDVLAGIVEAGEFPQVPGQPRFDAQRHRPSYENCRYCPYDRICPAGDRARVWGERKRETKLASFIALSEVIVEESGLEGEVGG